MKSRVWLWLSVFGFLLLMFVAVGFAASLGQYIGSTTSTWSDDTLHLTRVGLVAVAMILFSWMLERNKES